MFAHLIENNFKRFAGAFVIALTMLIATATEEISSNSHRTAEGNGTRALQAICTSINTNFGQPFVEAFNQYFNKFCLPSKPF
ncbi:MAG: hypothetical protein C0469_03565 [Cyanobacteria bacterium DS2.3.42]|nr:hypothetical protein [Cyanobacteria bacterium DS2.3.42]